MFVVAVSNARLNKACNDFGKTAYVINAILQYLINSAVICLPVPVNKKIPESRGFFAVLLRALGIDTDLGQNYKAFSIFIRDSFQSLCRHMIKWI